MKNREGQRIELSELSKVEEWDGSYSVTMKDSWSFGFSKEEAGDFVPREGDWVLVSYEGFNTIAGIIIEGRVIRAKSSAQCKRDHEQMVKGFRLDKLERYIEHGEALKERVKALHPVLQARMERFAARDGVEFWIDSAPYEMAILEGAQALLNKTANLYGRGWAEENGTDEDRAEVAQKSIKWVKDWWALNTAEHGYDYKKQMEMLPEFGEGHSGNTAGVAYQMALMILEGDVENL